MYIGLYVKCPVFLWDFNGTSVLSTGFLKSYRTSSLQIRPVEAELFHVYRQTVWRDETNTRFSKFYERA
jgi:hypothetical protein